jgi:hypothetical protein
LYLKISRHRLEICWWQIELTGEALTAIHGSLNQLKAIDDRPFEHGSLNGSGLLVKETEVTGENHRPVANHRPASKVI